jgi:large subunit ribosomal protein L4
MRDYTFRINKKERKKALVGAISARRAEENLFVLGKGALGEAKSRSAQLLLASLGIEKGSSVLIVLAVEDRRELLGFRNLQGVKVVTAEGLNVYDVLAAESLIISESALGLIESRFPPKQ